MKLGKIVLVSVVGVLCILMAGMIGCKEKRAAVERSTDTSSEDYSYDKTESLDESDVISEYSETESYPEQTDEKWYEEDENEPNVPDEEPNESPEEPNEQWL